MVMRLAVEAQCEENPIASFIEKANIKLDTVDISQVMLHCKHIMTIDDEFNSLKKYGLMTLDKVLTYDTPLHNFLEQHDIEIDVGNRKIFYKGKKIHLYQSDKECEECFYGGECRYLTFINGEPETLSYRNMACDFRNNISTVRTKLYVHKAEIEVHLSGEIEEVHNYSEVKYYPEILVSLEQMICKLFKESPHLEEDWRKKQAGKYYCLDFDVNIVDFERITSNPILENCSDYYEFNKEPLYSLNDANSNFYGNIFILNYALDILKGHTPTVYGQLLPNVNVSYEEIEITKFTIETIV